MKRSVGSAGASDVLQRLGRPGFPKGMVVLLVGGAEYERVKIEKQMSKLCYKGKHGAYSFLDSALQIDGGWLGCIHGQRKTGLHRARVEANVGSASQLLVLDLKAFLWAAIRPTLRQLRASYQDLRLSVAMQ